MIIENGRFIINNDPKYDHLSQNINVNRNILLSLALTKFGVEKYNYLNKLVDVWININYLGCRYNFSLEKEANNIFSPLEKLKKID